MAEPQRTYQATTAPSAARFARICGDSERGARYPADLRNITHIARFGL